MWDNRDPVCQSGGWKVGTLLTHGLLDNELVIRVLGQKERQSLGHALEVRTQTISWELDSYEGKSESARI